MKKTVEQLRTLKRLDCYHLLPQSNPHWNWLRDPISLHKIPQEILENNDDKVIIPCEHNMQLTDGFKGGLEKRESGWWAYVINLYRQGRITRPVIGPFENKEEGERTLNKLTYNRYKPPTPTTKSYESTITAGEEQAMQEAILLDPTVDETIFYPRYEDGGNFPGPEWMDTKGLVEKYGNNPRRLEFEADKLYKEKFGDGKK